MYRSMTWPFLAALAMASALCLRASAQTDPSAEPTPLPPAPDPAAGVPDPYRAPVPVESAPAAVVEAPSVLDSPPPSAATPAAALPPAAAGRVPAQVAEELESTWGQQRTLGGHSFQLGTFVPSALISSYVGVRAGIEYHEVPGFAQLPTLVSSGPQAVDLRTVNVAETIDFSVRLHDHFAIFGDGYGRARVGANINTLLGTGADYTYGGDLGLIVKLFTIKSFQISLRGQVGYYAGQSAGILALFQDLSAIAQGAIQEVQRNPVANVNDAIYRLNNAFRTATSDLLTPFSGFAWGGSLNIAQAIGKFVGIQASAGFYLDTASYRPTHFDIASNGPLTVEHDVTTTRPTVGLALDVDLEPAGFPLGLMVEYRATALSIADSLMVANVDSRTVENLLAVGAYYSGRTDLQLGLTAYTLFGQAPTLGANAVPSGKPLDLATQLVFRYFW
jgi:hypothetical protein